MLILQAVLFYLIAGPYVALRKIPDGAVPVEMDSDRILRWLLLAATVLILAVYYLKTGRFLVVDLLAGRINRVTVIEYRAFTYGLPEYPYFRLGFLVFPALAAALTVAIASARNRLPVREAAVIGFCLLPPMLLAEKAAILHMAAVIVIAYGIHLGSRGKPLAAMLTGKTLLLILAAFIPTAAIYLIYFGLMGEGIQTAWDQFVFRIVGVYSESLAATVPFVKQHGYLGGITMPNLKGLLPYDRFNLESAMHAFLSSGTEAHLRTALHGASPVPATGEGYINFGWPGFVVFAVVSFLCVLLFQEVLLRLYSRMPLLTIALSAWYGYLGFTMFTTTIFATFISLIHTVVAIGVVACWCAIRRWQAAGS
jgi:hypothetical protein